MLSLKHTLAKEIEVMEKELRKIDEDNQAKQTQYENEQNQLVEEKTEREFQQQKRDQLKNDLNAIEQRVGKAKEVFVQKCMQLDALESSYHSVRQKNTTLLYNSLTQFNTFSIADSHRYGDMHKFKRDIEEHIAESKSRSSLGEQELRGKQEELGKLKKDFGTIAHPEIGANVKKEIVETCTDELRTKRKNLVDLKMQNHALKCKCASVGIGEI